MSSMQAATAETARFISVPAKHLQMHPGNFLLGKYLQNKTMPVWSFCIDSVKDRSGETLGFVRAPTAQAALQQVRRRWRRSLSLL